MTRFSPYNVFTREDWGRLRADAPLTLTEAELTVLRGQNEQVSLSEVADIYLPLTRLLNLYVESFRGLHDATSAFLRHNGARVPYIIGVAGSVAVGKSTTSRILQALLARLPGKPKVALVPTDGFLFNNRRLAELGLVRRKGFPESYDLPRLIEFVSDAKAGRRHLQIPVYSHHTYDILPGETAVIDQPDIMIVEGLNVLQTGPDPRGRRSRVFISDYFDFTIYVDAKTEVIRHWYVERFLTFRRMALDDPSMFFHRFAPLSEDAARAHAARIWEDINELNLIENILPARERAHLILYKGQDHSVESVQLRKL